MGFFDYLKIASIQISKNKLRTVLTILGIVIGIASMITVVSVGEGGQKQINSELNKFGINRVWLFAQESGQKSLRLDDAEMLQRRISDNSTVCPAVFGGALMGAGNLRISAEIGGVTQTLAEIESMTLLEGRFVSNNDVKYNRKVIVLSKKSAERLFKNKSALNESVYVNGNVFKVIGVLKEENSIASAFVPQKSFMPINVFMELMNKETIDEISISAKDSKEIERSTKTCIALLSKKYGEGSISMVNLEKEVKNANSILDTFKLIIGSIACISLIVGGIGIMNIMLVTVKERTREIGIRKACGARDMHIFGQFLCESLIFSLVGGGLGVAFGIGLTFAAQSFIGLAFGFSTDAAVLSVVISAMLGILFGLFPAARASRLNTVDALRITN